MHHHGQSTTTDASGTSSNLTTVFDSETVRGRLGYAFDNILLYGTSGWAWSSNQYVRTQLTGTLNLATAGTDEAVNTYLGGWTAGAGVAVAFAQNWNAFAEYRYTSFGSVSLLLPFSQLSTTLTTKVSAVELGLNYKLNWGGPASAGSVAAPNLRGPAPALVYKPPPASGAYSWTGFYFGGDGGYGWETARGTLTTAGGVPLAPYSTNVNGPFAGGFVGGNYQFDHVVAGVEGDWQWGNLTGNNQQQAAIGAAGAFPGGPFTISTTIKDYKFDPRPARHRLRSLPGFRHCRLGMGQSLDLLRPSRSGSVRHQWRQFQRLDGRCRGRLRLRQQRLWAY